MGFDSSFLVTQQVIRDQVLGDIGQRGLVDSLLVHFHKLLGELVQAAEKVAGRDWLARSP